VKIAIDFYSFHGGSGGGGVWGLLGINEEFFA